MSSGWRQKKLGYHDVQHNRSALQISRLIISETVGLHDLHEACMTRCMCQSEGVPVDEAVERSRQVGLTASSPLYPPAGTVSEDSRLGGSLYSDTSFASSFNPDNVSVERHPVILG